MKINLLFQYQGEKKIASMVEYKDFSKGIFKLEWEHKKMRMQIEDLKQKAQDIVTLSITKDRQLVSDFLQFIFRSQKILLPITVRLFITPKALTTMKKPDA